MATDIGRLGDGVPPPGMLGMADITADLDQSGPNRAELFNADGLMSSQGRNRFRFMDDWEAEEDLERYRNVKKFKVSVVARNPVHEIRVQI